MTGTPMNQTIDSFVLVRAQTGQISDAAAAAVLALCDAAKQIAKLASQNGIGAASLGTLTGAENTDGDEQKALDVLADELICEALAATGIAAYLS